MFFLTTFITIILSLVSLMVAVAVFGSIRNKTKYPIVIDFLAFASAVNIFLWHSMPAILRLSSYGQHEVSDRIDHFEILTVYTIEFISFILFFIPFLIIFRVKKINLLYFRKSSILQIISDNRSYVYNNYSSYFLQSIRPHSLFILILTFIGLYFQFQRHFIGQDPSLFPALDWLLVPIVYKSALFLVIHSVFTLEFSNNKILKAYFVLILIIFLIGDIAQGSHGSIFAPVLYFIFYNIFHNLSRPVIYLSIILILFLSLFYEEMHQVRAYNNMANVESMGVVEKLTSITSDDGLSDTHTPGNNFLDKIEWRFGENSRMSVGYLRMYDRGYTAGLNPLENSLYFLPRNFYPQKPIPGSIDGTELGLGMRLMNREIRGTLWNMSGFFTGVHSYWELGIFGVFIISLFVGLYSSLLTLYCGNFYYLGLPLIIIMHDTWWWATPKLWSYEVIIQLFNLFIPFLFIWFFFKFTYKFFALFRFYLISHQNIK